MSYPNSRANNSQVESLPSPPTLMILFNAQILRNFIAVSLILSRLRWTLRASVFQTAIDRGLSDADISARATEFLGAINDFYDLQIEQIRNIETATGAVLFDEIQAINNLRSERLNQARLQLASDSPNFQAISRQQGRRADQRAAADTTVSPEYAQYQAAVTAAEVDTEALKRCH